MINELTKKEYKKTGKACFRCKNEVYETDVEGYNYVCLTCDENMDECEVNDIKILIACEESQAVCKEFRKLGYKAFSCDTLPCSGGHPEWHIQGDVLEQLDKGWDLMVAHPPCTHLAVSGARHFPEKIRDGRQQQGIDFFMALINAPIPRIAVENPICIMSTRYRKPDQIIQPWMFGDKVTKSTCLWLKNLPKIKPTNIVDKGEFKEWITKDGKKKRQHMWYYNALRQKNTGGARSKTFPGIAKAIAEQWSCVFLGESAQ